MVHFRHQKNLKYKKAQFLRRLFASMILLLLNNAQLSVKEYNWSVTDVLFDKGLIETKTIEKTIR